MQKKWRNILAVIVLALISIVCFAACNNGQTVSPTTVEISEDGYWIINGENTGVKALGKDGDSVSVDINDDGYWVIGGINTNVSAVGTTPKIEINEDGFWVINGVVTTVNAHGKDGVIPNITISEDGFWVINGTTTDMIAKGETPSVSISEAGCWIIDGEETDIIVRGSDGKGVFELYKEIYGYDGTAEEWLNDVLNGTLGTAVKRTVTLDYNGFESDDEMPTEIKVNDGRTVVLPELERDGYKFLGWYTGNGVNDGKWLNTLVVSSDLNLVAKWQKKAFTVRFETEEGALLKSETVEFGDSATPPAAPHIDGFTFSHWDGDYSEIIADIVIKPVYAPSRYTVTYDTDGGNEIPSESYLFCETPTAPVPPEKSGFIFGGWKFFGSDEFYDFDVPLTGDVTLVAVWTDTVSISDIDGLLAIADNMEAKYSLANDINLKGAEWDSLGEFKGVLDGNGHKIYNFAMSVATAQMGFFTVNSGTIKNIVFSDVAVNNSYSGASDTGIVAAINNGTMSGITVRESSINFAYAAQKRSDNISVGGVVGTNGGAIEHSRIEISTTITASCYVYIFESTRDNYKTYLRFGSVTGNNKGSINDIVTVTKLLYSATVTSSSNYTKNTLMYMWSYVGGIVGDGSKGLVSNVKAEIDYDVSFIGEGTEYPVHNRFVGGIVGYNGGEVSNAYSTGNIVLKNSGNNIADGSNDIGGIAGDNLAGSKIESCMSSVNFDYNASATNGSLGGIAGINSSSATILNSLYNGRIKTTKAYCSGGLIGVNSGTLSNSLFEGEIECDAATAVGGLNGTLSSSGSVMRCINDGQITATSGTPQYIASSVDGRTVVKCYRTENATLTDGEGNSDGAQADIAVLKEAAELYATDFIYDTMLFDEDVWGVENGKIYLIALADYITA